MAKMSLLDKAKQKEMEDLFHFHLQINGLNKYFVRELTFIPGRRFRLDFGDPIHKIGVEYDGAIWSPKKQGHNSGSGIINDQEKTNLGHVHGWRIFRFSDKAFKDLTAIDMIRRYYIQNLKIELPAAGKSH